MEKLSSGETRIITSTDLKWNNNYLPKKESVYIGHVALFKNFPLAGLVTRKRYVTQLEKISQIKSVELLSAGEADFYLPYLFGLDGVTEKSYELANISMQFSPKQRHIVLARAALDCAYESMAMRGTLAIVAAGNYGGYGTGIMNALACSRWIVGVGAAYADGRRLWEQSSWGIPNDPIIHRPLSLPESKFLLQARN